MARHNAKINFKDANITLEENEEVDSEPMCEPNLNPKPLVNVWRANNLKISLIYVDP